MGDRVWQLPRERFIAVWNAAETPAEAAEKVKRAVGGGAAPRWAVMARAGALREEGVQLREHRSAKAA